MVTSILAILYLVILEGVLSVDNALALAALVRSRLPDPKDQARALKWGIAGAYIMRTGIIFIGVWLMEHEWVRWVAALYLIYLGTKELFFKPKAHDTHTGAGLKIAFLSPLVSTIIAVECMDLMFSIDSIAVTLSVSREVWVLVTGAVLGILAMRFAATYFIKLMDRFPILEKTAFVLVLLAGIKIVLELVHVHIPETAFIAGMFSIIAGSMVLGKRPEPVKVKA